MNKIVRKHYPVERLPADLRAGLPAHSHVDIELAPERAAPELQPIAHLVGSGANVHGDAESVLEHIRDGRNDR